MRILYIDHYTGSPILGMEYRPHVMATEWAGMDAEIVLLADTRSHLRKKDFPDMRSFEPVEIDDVELRFIRNHAYDGNGIGRMLGMADFVGRGWLVARRIAREVRPDAVIASSTYPFDTYLAQRVAKASGALLVHKIHDLWPLTPIELGGHSPKHPSMWVMAQAEKLAYRSSDTVVSILPNAEPHARSLGIVTPVISIPSGIESDAPYELAPEAFASQVEDLHERGRAVIGYAGGITNANAMDDSVSAMALIRDEPVTALLLGDGLYRTNLEKRARDFGAHVIFAGNIPKSQVREALKLRDVLYIGSKTSPLYTFEVSASKIFDYIATGAPITNAFTSEHSPIVYAGSIIRARGEDPADIARAVRRVVSLPAEERARLGKLSATWVCEHHAMPVPARQFLDVLGGRF